MSRLRRSSAACALFSAAVVFAFSEAMHALGMRQSLAHALVEVAVLWAVVLALVSPRE